VLTLDRPSKRSKMRAARTTNALLACGVAYFVTYVIANDGIAATTYDGYSRVDQAISELSAKGASTRPFLMAMLPVWTVLMVGCGIGVWRSASGKRTLRALGAVLVAWGVTGIMWLPFPMTSRAEMVRTSTGTNDVGHLVLSGATFLFIFSALALGAAALGSRFRWYSVTSGVVIFVFGGMVAAQAGKIPKGQATPWMGLEERISVYGALLWVAVLAVTLWWDTRNRETSQTRTRSRTSRPGRDPTVHPITTAE